LFAGGLGQTPGSLGLWFFVSITGLDSSGAPAWGGGLFFFFATAPLIGRGEIADGIFGGATGIGAFALRPASCAHRHLWPPQPIFMGGEGKGTPLVRFRMRVSTIHRLEATGAFALARGRVSTDLGIHHWAEAGEFDSQPGGTWESAHRFRISLSTMGEKKNARKVTVARRSSDDS